MSKYRFGWPDLLLPAALALALTGHFYPAMATLALYAMLYHRASRRHSRELAAAVEAYGRQRDVAATCSCSSGEPCPEPAAASRLTREDVACLYGVPEDLVLPRQSGPTRTARADPEV